MHTIGCVSKHLGRLDWKIRSVNAEVLQGSLSGEVSDSTLPRKVSME